MATSANFDFGQFDSEVELSEVELAKVEYLPPFGAPHGPSLFLGLAHHPLGPHHDTHQIPNYIIPIGLAKIGLAKIGFGQNWPGQNHDGQKMDWPKLDWPKLVKSGWPTWDWPKLVSSINFGIHHEVLNEIFIHHDLLPGYISKFSNFSHPSESSD